MAAKLSIEASNLAASNSEAEQSWVRLILVIVFSSYLTLEVTFGNKPQEVMLFVPPMLAY
jgi:hypothetical protein